MKTITLQIASVPDKENIVAEIWFGNDQVAEVSNDDSGNTRIEIFSSPTDESWSLDFNDFQEILTKAKNNLKDHY